ncbi:MAG: SGNH/GDSL hydrolase family protein [Archangiaceae bacterium]|nr:SGNH/GDSL hydrolase family protein [Archangiaceae bacterium]
MGAQLRQSRSRPGALAIAALVVALTVVVGVALRAAARPEPSSVTLVATDDGCFFGLAPNQHGYDAVGPHVEHLLTDADGFRISASEPTPGARCQVLTLGDSFTEGSYVEAEATFSAELQRQLRAKSFDVAVRNGGTRGYTIAQERTAALARWPALAPRVVVVELTANDLLELYALARDGCELERAQLPDGGLTAWSPDALRLAVARVGQKLKGAAGGLAELPAERCEPTAHQYAALAESLTARLAAAGTRTLFVNLEGLACGQGRGVDPRQLLERRVTAAGGAWLDASAILAGDDARLWPEDNHPSELGHRRIGVRIADALLQLGWLSECR